MNNTNKHIKDLSLNRNKHSKGQTSVINTGEEKIISIQFFVGARSVDAENPFA